MKYAIIVLCIIGFFFSGRNFIEAGGRGDVFTMLRNIYLFILTTFLVGWLLYP